MRFKPIISFIILSLTWSLTSCKKAEDDPALTLRTRKARLVGNWTMKSGTSYEYWATAYIDSYTTTYTQNAYNQTHDRSEPNGSNRVINSYTGEYSYSLKFRKDGTFESTKTKDKTTVIMTGNWNFIGSGENAKNKERITITITHVDNGSGQISYTYTGNNAFYNFSGSNTLYTYKIKELRNKKLVISSESYVSGRPNLPENSLKDEYIFEP